MTEYDLDEHLYDVDFEAGNGSGTETDAWIDDISIGGGDGRAKTRTSIKAKDGNASDVSNPIVHRDGETLRKWEWLAQLQDGRRADDVKTRKNLAELKRDVQAWCSALDAPKHITDRILHLLDNVETFERGNTKAEATALAMISLVCNENDWWVQRQEPSDPLAGIRFGPEVDGGGMSVFRSIANDCDVDMSNIHTIRNDLRDELL